MKYRFIIVFMAIYCSLISQECLHVHVDHETLDESLQIYYQKIDSLLNVETLKLKSNGPLRGLNVPLNFIFFYDPGEAIVPEEQIIATIERTNEVAAMNGLNANFYLGCVRHIFDEPDMVVWDNVRLNLLFGLIQINLGFNEEFIIQSLSDIFTFGINVFVPREIEGAQGLGGLVGPARIVAVDRDQVRFGGAGGFTPNGDGTFTSNAAETTFIHEIGHYCGLFHTDDAFLGTIVNGSPIPNPIGLPFRRCRLEAVNRNRNYTFWERLLCGQRGRICRSASDGFCDTNADPGIVNTFAPTGCNILTDATMNLAQEDPWGTRYLTPGEEPMTGNLMSQRLDRTCRWQITPEQVLVMRNFLNGRFSNNPANPDQFEPNDSNDPGTRTQIALNERQLHTRHQFTCDNQLDPVDNLVYFPDANSTLDTYEITVSNVAGENNPVANIVVFEGNQDPTSIEPRAIITNPATITQTNNGNEIMVTINATCNNHPDAYVIQVNFNNTGDLGQDLGCYNIEVNDTPQVRMVPFGNDIVCENQTFEILNAPATATIAWTAGPMGDITLSPTAGTTTSISSFTPGLNNYWVEATITNGTCTRTIANEFSGFSTTPLDYQIVELRESCWDEFEPDGLHTFGTYQILPNPIGAEIEWIVVGGDFRDGENEGNIVRVSPNNPGDFNLGVRVTDECGQTTMEWDIFVPGDCIQYCVGNGGTHLEVQSCELNVDLDLKDPSLKYYSYIISDINNRMIMDTSEFMYKSKFSVDVSKYPPDDYLLQLYCQDNSYNEFKFRVKKDVCSDCEIEARLLNLEYPTCGMEDGYVYISPENGTAPYTWDAGSGPQPLGLNNDGLIDGLGEGDYTVTITDGNGCTAEVEFFLKAFELSLENYIFTDHQCAGELFSIELNMQASTGPFTYTWSNGLTTAGIDRVPSGYYTVTVTDNDGCTGRKTFNLKQVTTSIKRTNAFCGQSNGMLEARPQGVGPFTYQWSNGGTTKIITELPIGNYSVTVTDASGCTATRSTNLGDDVTITFEKYNEACEGNNGTITAIPRGLAPFSYQWDNGATTQSISDLNAGTYRVTVTDQGGCTGARTTTITHSDYTLDIDPNIGDPICGLNNGIIIAEIKGLSRPPLSYSWSTGATTKQISDLSPGTYSVTITDGAGCSGSSSVTLENVDEFSINSYGGDAGLSEGRYFPAGITIDWFFNPISVADQLIIDSPHSSILNTGTVTNDTQAQCDEASCCSNYFLGDLVGQSIDLVVGNGVVSSSGIGGQFTTSVSGDYTFNVNGAICASGTGWTLTVSCSGNSARMAEEIGQIEELSYSSTSVKENGKLQDISVYPNPVTDELRIDKSKSGISSYNLKLINVDGKIIKEKSNITSNLEKIDVSNYPEGVYFMHIFSENMSLIKRIIVQ